MSDKTKNYKIKIDTDVKGDDAVKNLGKNIEEVNDKFKKLGDKIRDTKDAMDEAKQAGDTATFNKLKKELTSLETQFEILEKQTKNFGKQLGEMPGVLGKVGGGFRILDNIFKLLVANPLLAILGALAGILMGIHSALTKTTEGTAALNKVSEAFGRIITPIINFISATAVPVIEGFANAIDWLGKKLGLVSESSTNITNINKDMGNSFEELTSKLNYYAEKLQKYNKLYTETYENNKLSDSERDILLEKYKKEIKYIEEEGEIIVKLLNDMYKDKAKTLYNEIDLITLARNEREKDLLFLEDEFLEKRKILSLGILDETERNNALIKLREVYNNKVKEINKKYDDQEKAERDAKENEKLQLEKVANDIIFRTKLSLLDEQNKELQILEKQHIEEKAALKKAGYDKESKEMLLLINTFEKEQNRIRVKYRDIEYKEQKQAFDDLKKLIEEYQKDVANKIQKNQDKELNITKNQFFERLSIINDEKKSFKERAQAADDAANLEIEIFKKTHNINAENQHQYEEQLNEITQRGANTRNSIRAQEATAYGDIAQGFGTILQDIAEMGDKNLEKTKGLAIAGILIEKAGSIAGIVANTLKNASSYGYLTPMGIAEMVAGTAGVTSTILQATKAIQQIKQTNKDSTADTSSSIPSFAPPTIAAPQISVNQENTVGQNIAASINSTQNKSVQKIYVVSNDVSSSQALDRRTKQNATF